MSKNLLAGTASVVANGVNYMLVGDLAYDPSTVKRETKTGQDGVHGYSEMPKPGKITGTFRDSGSLTVADFNAMTNATVVLSLANGKTVIGRNMWTIDAQEVKTAEGTVEVSWEGPSVTEVTA
ncbi:phage tail tube protein [Pseudomonas lurida]|uniref:phage tail tube protein n=1 Tax=Pseudomonas lurida TaxID=244566 RepID=UPI001656BDEE|nr:phage tail tube protein [Pseudomonas lurida]MBC8984032.1 phage tail tube protein [Pseudomonas lurida]